MQHLIVANWKMNLGLAESVALAQSTARIAEKYHQHRIVIAPAMPWLVSIKEAVRFAPPTFSLAAQSVSNWPEGAYTGDVAATQLKGLVSYCLVGHSERRRYHQENGSVIAGQIQQLLAVNVTPIVCFGEMTQSQQAAFSPQVTTDLDRDLAGLSPEEIQKCVFAYEPLWAIGTGVVASPDYIKKVLKHVRPHLEQKASDAVSLLYGGSVAESNAADLATIPGLDGLLVGGASLHAKRFAEICRSFHGRL